MNLMGINQIDKEQKDKLTELAIDEWIWISFIILSVLNIAGDELDKDFCLYQDMKEKSLSKKIFNLTVFVSFLIYSYLAYRGYKRLKFAKKKNQNVNLAQSRLFANILIVVAAMILLYAQVKEPLPQNPSIE